MKVHSREDEYGNIIFDNFTVKKESDNFYGVYGFYCSSSQLVTSAETRDMACKKAKLLQIGFNICEDEYRDYL